ncbi:MAG TPA: metallophosphoesterase, partial [Burkholderiaceae bacterium]
VAFASGLAGCAARAAAPGEDFHFVQLSDSHWGFQGPVVNPEARATLPRAVAEVNALAAPPDFVVFTGDLTHATDDAQERRKRMREVRAVVADLGVRDLRFLPGEHDAGLDRGAAFQEFFGPTHWAFDHRGVHFIALDNVSDPTARLGDAQLAWLAGELAKPAPDAPVVVFAHRPLFDLAPQWDWATRDGDQAVALLMRHPNVTVFYGHIHQEHHHMTGHIAHHAATSLIFPLPAPGSQPDRTPVRWDPARPFHGLGWREVARHGDAPFALAQHPVAEA